MIIFKEIQYKNFLSTGNNGNTIFLNDRPTVLITGQNGSGKSTVLDALCYGIFNKPYRNVSKTQLINTVNDKDCVVQVKFDVNNTSYRVVRGMKPGIFEIYKNEVLITQDAHQKDYQKKLEELIGLNFKSFTQIVILGSSTFVPFMQLSGSNRRDVIEDLLDIRIFSAMNSLIKDKIRVKKEKIRSLDLKKDNLKDKMTMQNNFIKELLLLT